MSHPIIETDDCIGCGICVDACPQEVLEVVNGVADVVNEENCIACGDCVEECPMGAIPEVAEDQFVSSILHFAQKASLWGAFIFEHAKLSYRASMTLN